MVLVNVTQFVEYPLLLSHTILYFVTLKISLEYQSVQAGGLLDGSEFYSCHSTHHLSLRLPAGHLVVYSQFLYLPALDSFLTSSPGTQASGTTIPYYSHEGPSALDSGYSLTVCLSNVY